MRWPQSQWEVRMSAGQRYTVATTPKPPISLSWCFSRWRAQKIALAQKTRWTGGEVEENNAAGCTRRHALRRRECARSVAHQAAEDDMAP